MNVHHLELFFYVAKYEGITAAVRKMPYGIQQPAVSGQILQLENSLGVKLFNRRPFALTSAGEELYDHIYPFFSKIGTVESQLKGEERNTLRVAASAMVLKTHLPIVLGVMKRENPDLKLQLKHVSPAELLRSVQEELVDLAITVVAGDLVDPIKLDVLLDLPLVLLVPKDYEEKNFEDILQVDAYEKGMEIKYPLVAMEEDEIIMKAFQRFVSKKEVVWNSSVQVSALDVIQEYVIQGFGVGLSLKVPGRKFSDKVRAIPLPGCDDLKLGVIYQGKLKPIGQDFVKHAKEAATALIDATS